MRTRGSHFYAIALATCAVLTLTRCTKPYRDQERAQEFATMEAYFKSQKLNVWKYDNLYYVAEERGDSLRVQDGDVMELYYALFALSGGKPLLLATNDTASARLYQFPPQSVENAPLRVEIGKTPLFKGLEMGLKSYAHLNAWAWLGIPSEFAFGAKRFGRVPSNTPILCHINVVSATSERVTGGE